LPLNYQKLAPKERWLYVLLSSLSFVLFPGVNAQLVAKLFGEMPIVIDFDLGEDLWRLAFSGNELRFLCHSSAPLGRGVAKALAGGLRNSVACASEGRSADDPRCQPLQPCFSPTPPFMRGLLCESNDGT
jgi:hypothetical protein